MAAPGGGKEESEAPEKAQPRGAQPIERAGSLGGYFALRKSFGVTSQTSWPFGGETRFSSTKATPAFLIEVLWRCPRTTAVSRLSTCGAWPKQNTDEASFSRASSRKNAAGGAPGGGPPLGRLFCSDSSTAPGKRE